MEYFTLLYVIYKDETPNKTSIYKKDSWELAVQGVHQHMGTYMCDENVASVMVAAMNSIGGTYKKESWTAPVETPHEPTPEEIDSTDEGTETESVPQETTPETEGVE